VDEAALVSRFALATVFVLAGLAKLPRRAEFEAAVRAYGLLPRRLVRPVAAVLPPLELVGGLLLGLGLAITAVASLLAACLAAFAAAVALNLARGRAIDCGCFGWVAERRITWMTVLRNLGLIAIAVIAAIGGASDLALDRLVGRNAGVTTTAALAWLVVGTLAAFLTLLAHEGLRLRRLVGSAKEVQN
jgi:uncharacterized membrane protein YphA (DoxX/SURF4 family)